MQKDMIKAKKEIQKLINEGCSFKDACEKVAEGKTGVVLKYQNMFRDCKHTSADDNVNVLKFPTAKKKISDSDLQSLFMGLVKIVKANTLQDYESGLNRENEKLSFLLKKALKEIKQKESEIKEIKVKNKELNLKIKKITYENNIKRKEELFNRG